MTKEEKELLLKDLCARLPYRVKCVFHSKSGDIASTIVKIDIDNEMVMHKPDEQTVVYFHFIESGYIKPYLRPIESMNEDDMLKFTDICLCHAGKPETESLVDELLEFYCSRHLDFHGLIPKGLALEVTEENNPYK